MKKKKGNRFLACSVVSDDSGIAFIRLWEKEQETGK